MFKLRRYEKADANDIIRWIKDENSFRKWCANRYEKYPITADDMNRYYAQYHCDDFYILTAVDENQVIGHLTIRFTDEAKKVARFGFIIIDDAKNGKQMIASALQYAFDVLKVDKVTLGVFENNAPAYNCYKSIGFRDAATEKDEYYPINGENWKCLEPEMDKSAFGSCRSACFLSDLR